MELPEFDLRFWLYFLISVVLYGGMCLFYLSGYFYLSGGIWSWIDAAWGMLSVGYLIFVIFHAGTKWPFILGIVAGVLIALALKLQFHLV